MISEKNSLSFMNVCKLITVTSIDDENGNPNESETFIELFCAELSVPSNEFFKAKQSGFKAQKVIVVNSDEYTNQTIVEYENKRYSVYRYYLRADGYTELYCEGRIGNG